MSRENSYDKYQESVLPGNVKGARENSWEKRWRVSRIFPRKIAVPQNRQQKEKETREGGKERSKPRRDCGKEEWKSSQGRASNVRETRFARAGTTHEDSRPKHEGAAWVTRRWIASFTCCKALWFKGHIESNQIYLSSPHMRKSRPELSERKLKLCIIIIIHYVHCDSFR